MDSISYARKQKYQAWFQRLEYNRRFLVFVQMLRESGDEMVEAEDAAAAAAAAHDGNDGGNAAESRANTGYGLARTRLAAFVDAPSDAMLEAAILRRGEVPPFGRQEGAHQLRPAANAAEAPNNA
jgi:hypothetical protein